MVQIASGSTPITEIGEFGLIRGLSNLLKGQRGKIPTALVDVGDDAAIWEPRPGWRQVITTDMLVEGVHFRRDWSTAEQIGHRALAVNISDIAAMGGRPRWAVIALGLRGDEQDRWVYDLYRGAIDLGRRTRLRIIGGDIVSSPRQATISVTVVGEVNPRAELMQRNRAQAGDVIAVTGLLGLAAGGVRMLETGQQRADGAPRMIEAHRKPQPRVFQGMLLAKAGVRCAMDLSDGLLGDLPKICEASDVQAIIEADLLPIPHAVRWSFPDWWDLALRGGEDFELLFTCPPELFDKVTALFIRYGCRPPTRIGTLFEPNPKKPLIQLRRTDRRLEPIEPGAFDHLSAGV